MCRKTHPSTRTGIEALSVHVCFRYFLTLGKFIKNCTRVRVVLADVYVWRCGWCVCVWGEPATPNFGGVGMCVHVGMCGRFQSQLILVCASEGFPHRKKPTWQTWSGVRTARALQSVDSLQIFASLLNQDLTTLDVVSTIKTCGDNILY
jgi:hypothetical protein